MLGVPKLTPTHSFSWEEAGCRLWEISSRERVVAQIQPAFHKFNSCCFSVSPLAHFIILWSLFTQEDGLCELSNRPLNCAGTDKNMEVNNETSTEDIVPRSQSKFMLKKRLRWRTGSKFLSQLSFTEIKTPICMYMYV